MFEGLSGQKLLKPAIEAVENAISGDTAFMKKAKEDCNFKDGKQWTETEKRILDAESRPALTMNVLKSLIDIVKGMYEDVRVRFYSAPVEPSDGPRCEVVDKVAGWVYEHYDIEEEIDEAVDSSTTCGRGWIAVDFDPDPKQPGYIKFNFNALPFSDIKIDPASRKNNLSDASYIVWDKWLTAEDFKILFPRHAKHIEDVMDLGMMLGHSVASIMDDTGVYATQPQFYDELLDYTQPLDMSFYDRSRKRVRIIHMEYWQTYKRYYRYVPDEQKYVAFDLSEKTAFEKLYPLLYGIPFGYETVMDKKVKWLQFVGDKVLYDGDSPSGYDGFSIVPCFAFQDVSKKTNMHYGVIRHAIDPQKEINKRWSQAIHWINTQVQPGVFAELGAFVDDKQAEASMREAGGITIMSEGALSGNRKIEERNVPQFPAAVMQMEQFSKDIVHHITGINLNLLGVEGQNYESGVVFQLRQNQGATILRPLFKQFKKMEEEIYRRVIHIVSNHMQPEQIYEILGADAERLMQSVDLKDLSNLKYNVDVEELPGSQTKRMMELSVFIEMMQYGFAVDPNVVISKTNLPESEKQGWIKYIQDQQQAQAEAAQKQYELEMMKIQVKMKTDTDKLQTGLGVDAAKLQQGGVKAVRRHEIEKERLANERRKMKLDFIARTAKEPQAERPARGM